MKKLLMAFVLVSCVGFASYPEAKHLVIPPSGSSGWDNASGTFRPLSVTNEGNLKIDGEINLGDATIDVVPSFMNDLGSATRAIVDSDDRAVVNIGSETVGLVTAIDAVTTEVSSPTEWAQQTVSLTADTAANITTGIIGSRKFIIVKSQDTSKQFWVSVDGAAVIGTNGMLVQDWVKLDAPETVTISVISSETLDLSVMEAGY